MESIVLPARVSYTALFLPEYFLVSQGRVYHVCLVMPEGLKMTSKKPGHLFGLLFSKELVMDSAVLCICFWDTYFHSVRRCRASLSSYVL